MIIVTSSFSKGSVFRMFSVYTKAKTKSQRFQIPPVSMMSDIEELRFRDGLVWTVGLRAVIKFSVTCSHILHTRNKFVTLWVNSINNLQFHP